MEKLRTSHVFSENFSPVNHEFATIFGVERVRIIRGARENLARDWYFLAIDYLVVHSAQNSAKILENQEERASLHKIGKGVFNLQDEKNNQNWTLSLKVDGEMRPFSMACYENKPGVPLTDKPQSGDACLKIKDHIFSHNNNFYSIGEAVPEGISPRDSISGAKYICRLVNFPFSHIDHIDEETKHQMKRYRGVGVGEIRGIGLDGFHLKLYNDELSDVSLELTASTYVIYTTHAINVIS